MTASNRLIPISNNIRAIIGGGNNTAIACPLHEPDEMNNKCQFRKITEVRELSIFVCSLSAKHHKSGARQH